MAVRRNASVDLYKVSVKALDLPSDIRDVTIRELEGLNLGNLGDLISAFETHGGNLTEISTPGIVIDQDQSDAIGDAILDYPGTPKALKDLYVRSRPAPASAVSGVTAKGELKPKPEWTPAEALLNGLTLGLYVPKYGG